MIRLLNLLYRELQAFLFPRSCGFCREHLPDKEPLCARCIQLIKPTLSTRLHLGSQLFIHVYGVSAYDEPLKTLILAKHRRAYEESEHLGTLIWRYSVMPFLKADYLIPVPLHSARLAQRGYNQALTIAQQISKLSDIPVFDCVVRTRNTSLQSRCTTYERYGNVRGAFKVICSKQLEGKSVLIVDDLMTSGATIGEVARVLAPCKVVSIRAVVACLNDR